MKKIIFTFILSLLLLPFSSFYAPCSAQESLIDTVMKSRASIVNILALQQQVLKSPNAAAAIDPRTGRMVIAQKARAVTAQKTGAGVILTPSGIIVTNLHTIYGAKKIFVKLHDNSAWPAQLLEIDPHNDLALLKIDHPQPLSPISLANSDTVQLGDDVINIGNSEYLSETLTGGKITGLGAGPVKGQIELIQVNMNLYKGDSGGPLLNNEGRLIGMIAAKLKSKNKTSFAIPANKIKKLYLDFKK